MKISLKAARINANISIQQVADQLGVSNKTVYRYENGKTDLGVLKAWELSKLYNLPIDMINFDALKTKKEV